MDGRITSELVEAYADCHRKAFLLMRGDPQGVQHDYCSVTANRATAARACYLAKWPQDDLPFGLSSSNRHSAQSSPILIAADMEATCDVLVPYGHGLSVEYEPHWVVGTSSVTPAQRLRLAFVGHVVGEVHKYRPTHGVVVLFEKEPQRIRLTPLFPLVGATIDILREWSKHLPADPPPLVLNAQCSTCPFHQLCRKEAEQQDSLSLLERVTPKVAQKYGRRGIFTINQLSYAYRPRRRRKKPAGAPPVFNLELQALAIRTGKIILYELPSIPKHPVELFLDIEGVPDDDLDYLIGLDICQDGQITKRSYWADSADAEIDIFRACLDTVAQHPNAPVFHYGSYEPRAFARIAKKHSVQCDWFTQRLVNVNASIFGKVYFPARSNRLKDLGPLVGASWEIPDASGLHSIAWRWQWEATREDRYKELLLAYNRSDCNALRLLTGELQTLGRAPQTRADVDFANTPRQKSTADGQGIHRVFEDILTAAHTEYQNKRICIRPTVADAQDTPKRKRQVGRAENRRVFPSCVGTTIHVPRKRKCPRHPNHALIPSSRTAEHRLIDLAFTRSGCRKTVVRYVGTRAYCPLCEFDYLPPEIRRLQGRIFGHHFQAWTVYQHVALRLPYRSISQTCEDLFCESFNPSTLSTFLTCLALEYAPTEERLLHCILKSPFIHADETKINIRGMNQLVWVLTDAKHVIFRRTETRESTLIQTLLEGYQGILISDFYGGYDAVQCRQQKCLVHLIRDLNDDLWKNPFNHDYERFVGIVRDLLVPIFKDIDRYGLRTRHLHKHRKAVDSFYRKTIDSGVSQCEMTAIYQKRFARYRESIFTFLDTDGLPWNNNMAERAIRHLAIQRKISGSFSASGADEHLRLLGLSQTCRFQGKSFLRFLLSGEKDVDQYRTKHGYRSLRLLPTAGSVEGRQDVSGLPTG